MARVDLGAIAERLFGDFLAPLVLGGPMCPGRPIGGRAALALGDDRNVVDADKMSRVEVVRVRVARALAPVDQLDRLDAAEWALGACLHDLVQTTHPDLAGLFRAKAPAKLLENVGATLERIPSAKTSHEALSRHTWFSRMFEIARTDTRVSWWTGSQSFLGEEPPARLTAWPELRRVHVDKTPHHLTELAFSERGARVPREPFLTTVGAFLARTPLTDLATLTRVEPAFVWRPESLALVATRSGRTLARRALAKLAEEPRSAALGRATGALLARGAFPAAHVAMDLLGDLALASAEAALEDRTGRGVPTQGGESAGLSRAAGALVAAQQIRAGTFAHGEPERLLAALAPWLESEVAKRLRGVADKLGLAAG